MRKCTSMCVSVACACVRASVRTHMYACMHARVSADCFQCARARAYVHGKTDRLTDTCMRTHSQMCRDGQGSYFCAPQTDTHTHTRAHRIPTCLQVLACTYVCTQTYDIAHVLGSLACLRVFCVRKSVGIHAHTSLHMFPHAIQDPMSFIASSRQCSRADRILQMNRLDLVITNALVMRSNMVLSNEMLSNQML